MRPVLLIIFLSITQFVCAKESILQKDKFQQNADSINFLLSVYDTLDMYHRQEWERQDKDGNVLPGVNPYSIEYIQSEIMDRLTYMLTDKKILHHKITDLIRESNTLFISCSEDSKLCFLSLDEKTGGTYRTTLTLIHYRLADGSLHVESGGEGYYAVYTLDPTRQKYFVIGEVIGCTTCRSLEAFTVTLDSVSFESSGLFDFQGRVNEIIDFGFDVASKKFAYDYFVGDEERSLYDEAADDEGTEEESRPALPEDYRCRRSGVYTYLEGHFFETEMHIVWEQEKLENK